MTEATITYRKTASGEWVAYGPADQLTPGPVVITKRDSTTRPSSGSEPFAVDGRQMAYGYLAPSEPSAPCDNCGRPGGRHQRYDSSGIAGRVCDQCRFEPSYCLSFA